MTKDLRKRKRLAVLFGSALILFNYPILSIVNTSDLIFGIPQIFVYLFSVWFILILLTVLITSGRTPGK